MPVTDLPSFIGKLAEASAVAHARLTAPAPAQKQADELLPTAEAARRLAISKTTLYHKNFPFTIRDPRTRRLRFSAAGIQRYIEQQTKNTNLT